MQTILYVTCRVHKVITKDFLLLHASYAIALAQHVTQALKTAKFVATIQA